MISTRFGIIITQRMNLIALLRIEFYLYIGILKMGDKLVIKIIRSLAFGL